jgi:hypothetical protein
MYAGGGSMFKQILFQQMADCPDAAVGTAWVTACQRLGGESTLRWTLLGDPAVVIKSGLLASLQDTQGSTPPGFALVQNYPNPFNPSTSIGFGVSGLGSRWVRLSVYDLLGREVAVLVDEQKQPGEYTASWDARGMASGVYFYRMTAGGFVECRKMMVLK